MKKYLVLYHAPVSAKAQMANATPEQAKAGIDAWMLWAGRAGAAICDMGSPVGDAEAFQSASTHQAVSSTIGGYTVMQAESLNALAALLDGHPHFYMPGASIEVHELLTLPGM